VQHVPLSQTPVLQVPCPHVPPQPFAAPQAFPLQSGAHTQVIPEHSIPAGQDPWHLPPQPSGAPHAAPSQLGAHWQALAMHCPPGSIAVHTHVCPAAQPVVAVPQIPPQASEPPQKAPPGGVPLGGHSGLHGPGQLK
jgi:hypothetical protein